MMNATGSSVRAALDEGESTTAKLEVHYFPNLLHYSVVLENHSRLFLSVYEKFRKPVVQSSVFSVDIGAVGTLQEYWLHTLTEFISKGRSERFGARDLRDERCTSVFSRPNFDCLASVGGVAGFEDPQTIYLLRQMLGEFGDERISSGKRPRSSGG